MKQMSRLLACSIVASFFSSSVSAAPADITWSDLKPHMEEIANPFESLTPDQMDALRRIVRLEGSGEQEQKAEADKLRADLTAQGLDVDGLFTARREIMEHRRAAANAVNDTIVGQEIRIPGYVLPLQFRDRKAVEFLLVPTVGACIHTPPPPANQLVHVVHPDGIEVKGLYEPVWVTGVMSAKQSVQDVRYSDGQSRVEVSYMLRPAQVEPYRQD
jgi:hypothetical protein